MMTKNVILVAVTILGMNAHATTMQQMQDLQLEHEAARIRSETAKMNAPSSPVAPAAPVARQIIPEEKASIALVGIYSIGGERKAILKINGADVTLASGESQLGFKVLRIDGKHAKLVKVTSKGIASGKEIDVYLTGSTEMQAPAAAGATTMLPPVPQSQGPMSVAPFGAQR